MSLPKPYYQDAHVTIYNGDCREIVPTLVRFDLLLTDPPYGIGEHGGACRTRGRPGYAKPSARGCSATTPDTITAPSSWYSTITGTTTPTEAALEPENRLAGSDERPSERPFPGHRQNLWSDDFFNGRVAN